MPARRNVRLPLAGASIVLAGLLACQLLGASSGLLYLVPALVVLVPLLAHRYPGERRIAALAVRRRPPVRRRPSRARLAHRRPLLLAPPAGGALLAFELAGRAPPFLR